MYNTECTDLAEVPGRVQFFIESAIASLPRYLLQGTAANRAILNDLDVALEQILQELVNLLPVQARVPSEVPQGVLPGVHCSCGVLGCVYCL